MKEMEPELNPEYTEDFFDSLMLNEMKKVEEESMDVESEDPIFIKKSNTETKPLSQSDDESVQSSIQNEEQETLNKNQKSKHLRKPLSTFAIPRPPHLETIKRPIYDRNKFISKPIRIAKRRADDGSQSTLLRTAKSLKALPDLVPVETFKKMKMQAQKGNNQYLPLVYHTFCGEPTASTSKDNPKPPPIMAYTGKLNLETLGYFAQSEMTNHILLGTDLMGTDPVGTDLMGTDPPGTDAVGIDPPRPDPIGGTIHAKTVQQNTPGEVNQCNLEGAHIWNTSLDELDKSYLGCRPRLSSQDESPSISALRCDVCFNQFLTQTGFDKHLERTVADMQINCWVCGLCLSFPNFCLLKRHILFHESDGFLMKGPLNVTVKTAAVLEDKDQSSNGKSKCTECNGFFDSLAEHLTEVVRPVDLDLKCRVCPYVPPSICGMRMHIRLHINKAPYSCPDCGRSFPTRRECIEHSANTCCHFDKSLRYRCSYCEVLFYDRLLFKNHLMNTHNTLIYRCSTCSYSCRSMKTITEHAARNHPESNAVNPLFHVCQICSNLLVPRGKYSGHIVDHMNDPVSIRYIYMCKKCGMVTVNRAQFMNHKLGSECQNIFSVQPIKADSTSQAGSSLPAIPKMTGGSTSNSGYNLGGKMSEKKTIKKKSYIYKCLLCGLIVDHVWTEVIKHCRGYHKILDVKYLHNYIVETTFAEEKGVIDNKNKRGVNTVNSCSKNTLKLAKMQKLTQKKLQKQQNLQVTIKPNLGRSMQIETQENLPVNPKVCPSQQNEIHETGKSEIVKACTSQQIPEIVSKHPKPSTSQQNEIKQIKTLRKRIYLKAGVTQKIEIREQMQNLNEKETLTGIVKKQQKRTGMLKNQQKLTGIVKKQQRLIGTVKTQPNEKLTGMVKNEQNEKFTGIVQNQQNEKPTGKVKNQQNEKLIGMVKKQQKEKPTGIVENQQIEKHTGLVQNQQNEKLTRIVKKQPKPTAMVKSQQNEKLNGMVKKQQKEIVTGMVKNEQKEIVTGMVKNEQNEKPTGMVVNQETEKLTRMVKNEQNKTLTGMVKSQQKCHAIDKNVMQATKRNCLSMEKNQEKWHAMDENQEKCHAIVKKEQKCHAMDKNYEKCHKMDKKLLVIRKNLNNEKLQERNKNRLKERPNVVKRSRQNERTQGIDKNQPKERSQEMGKNQQKESSQKIEKSQQEGSCEKTEMTEQKQSCQKVEESQQEGSYQKIEKSQLEASSQKIERSQQEENCQDEDKKHCVQEMDESQQKGKNQEFEKGKHETGRNQEMGGPHKCNKCSFSTGVMDEYRQHVIIHRKGPDLYQCLECAACFVVRPSLEKHLIGIHGIDAVDDYIKNHNVCHNLTKRSKALLPGQCSVCFEIFDPPNSLFKHFRSHGMAFLNQIKQV